VKNISVCFIFITIAESYKETASSVCWCWLFMRWVFAGNIAAIEKPGSKYSAGTEGSSVNT
jgi:hypothetical protein